MNRKTHQSSALRWTTSAGEFVTGTNVRRDDKNTEIWRPGGMPSTVRRDSWRPLQKLNLDKEGFSIVLMRSEALLGAIVNQSNNSTDELTGTMQEICQLTNEPLRFDITSPGTIRMLMKHAPTCYIGYAVDDSTSTPTITFTHHGEMPELPPLMLTAGDETTLSETLPTMQLSASGATHGSLNTADAKEVTYRLIEAYTQLRKSADANGFYLQPTLARYRLLDASGDTIVASPPLLIAPSTGFQDGGEITVTSTDSLKTISGGAIMMKAYRLHLTITRTLPEPWRSMVKSAVIETLSPIDPIDENAICSSSISNDGTQTTVALRLPGIVASSVANLARQRQLTIEALSTSASHWRMQGRINLPFSKTAIKQSVALRCKAPLQPHTTYPPVRDAISHNTALMCHNLLLLANEQRTPFAGYPLRNFIHTFATNGTWRASTTVKISTGNGDIDTVARMDSDSTLPPSALNALLSYPDANATEMSITLSIAQEKIVTKTVKLTPLPEADIAYYLADDLGKITPNTTTTFNTQVTTAKNTTTAGKVTICTPTRLCAPHSTFRNSSATIVAMHEAPRSHGTWDFARQKIVVFSHDGTRLVTLNDANAARSSALLDYRPVLNAHNVCTTTGNSGLELTVIAGFDLVKVSQNGVSTIVRRLNGDNIGYSPLYNELWLTTSDGTLCRLSQHDKQMEVINATLPTATTSCEIITWGNRMLIATDTALYDATTETYPDNGIPVELRLRHNFGHAPLRAVTYNLFSSAFNGSLCLSGDCGNRQPQPLMQHKIIGALNHPMTVRIIAPIRQYLETTLTATVSHDTEWFPPQLGK